MMIARAKWRALSGRTAFSIAPSRRCRCQSSGRRIVRLWVMPERLARKWPERKRLCASAVALRFFLKALFEAAQAAFEGRHAFHALRHVLAQGVGQAGAPLVVEGAQQG